MAKEKVSCENQPLWYKQLFKLPESKRIEIQKKALELIKEGKPDAYEFITKFKCKVMGFAPNLTYTKPDNSEGYLDVNFVHPFSQPTLLFWCENGGFAFYINVSLGVNSDGMFIY